MLVESLELLSSFTRCGRVLHCFFIVTFVVCWCFLCVGVGLLDEKKYVFAEQHKAQFKMVLF